MVKRMSAIDAAFIHGERPEAPQHGSILFILRAPEDAGPSYLSDLAAWMRSYPVVADRFNYVLTPGRTSRLRPTWTKLPPEKIDLDYHFRHSALPQPGGELELATLVSRLVTHPIDLDRAPWEIHLIEGLADNRFAILMKMHHAMIDGTAALRLIQTWLSEDPAERGQPPLWAHSVPRPERSAGSAGRLVAPAARVSAAAVRAPIESVGSIGKALAANVASRKGEHPLVSPYTAPRTILNGRVTQRRRMATQRLPLADFRAIAEATGGTINDAVAVVLGTAMRRYLLEQDALPDRPLISGVLISLHSTLSEEAAAKTGNAISMLFADLATEIEDVAERAKRVVASTTAGKDHLRDLGGNAIPYSFVVLAPFILGNLTGAGHRIRPLQNIALSNVPGTKKPLYHNGAEVEALHATTIIGSGGALVVTVTNWVSDLCFTLTGCPDTAPSFQRVSIYLADALDEVKKALSIA